MLKFVAVQYPIPPPAISDPLSTIVFTVPAVFPPAKLVTAPPLTVITFVEPSVNLIVPLIIAPL